MGVVWQFWVDFRGLLVLLVLYLLYHCLHHHDSLSSQRMLFIMSFEIGVAIENILPSK